MIRVGIGNVVLNCLQKFGGDSAVVHACLALLANLSCSLDEQAVSKLIPLKLEQHVVVSINRFAKHGSLVGAGIRFLHNMAVDSTSKAEGTLQVYMAAVKRRLGGCTDEVDAQVVSKNFEFLASMAYRHDDNKELACAFVDDTLECLARQADDVHLITYGLIFLQNVSKGLREKEGPTEHLQRSLPVVVNHIERHMDDAKLVGAGMGFLCKCACMYAHTRKCCCCA